MFSTELLCLSTHYIRRPLRFFIILRCFRVRCCSSEVNIAERSWDRGKELNVEAFAAGQTWGRNQIRGAVGALVCNWQTRWEQRLSSGRQAFVVMVQSADFGEREDLTFLWELNPSMFWGIFVQPQMGSPAMIICEITLQ